MQSNQTSTVIVALLALVLIGLGGYFFAFRQRQPDQPKAPPAAPEQQYPAAIAKQMEELSAALKEARNPRFEESKRKIAIEGFEGDVLTAVRIDVTHVKDISPVGKLTGLKRLYLMSWDPAGGGELRVRWRR